jgi:anti-anti-sigma regulatory factor
MQSLDLSGDSPCPHCGQVLWFLRRTAGGAVVLTFLPGLKSASESLARVEDVLSALGDSSRLILNLSRLRLISSMFLAMLVVLHRRMVRAEKTLRLCELGPLGREVFSVTRLDLIFDIYIDERQAME